MVELLSLSLARGSAHAARCTWAGGQTVTQRSGSQELAGGLHQPARGCMMGLIQFRHGRQDVGSIPHTHHAGRASADGREG